MTDILLIGLGNPGKTYHDTRHNLGSDTVRQWFNYSKNAATNVQEWREDSKIRALIASIEEHDTKITCLLPQTFMNNSGQAVAKFIRKKSFFSFIKPSIDYKRILIFHDDIELPFNINKFKLQGSASGHNGVRSIQQSLNTLEIPRLRLGIGRPHSSDTPVSEYVLKRFTAQEKSQLHNSMPILSKIISTFVSDGPDQAIELLNKTNPPHNPTDE